MKGSLPALCLCFLPCSAGMLTACSEPVPVVRTEPGSAMRYAVEQASIVPRHAGTPGARRAADAILQAAGAFPGISSVTMDEFTDRTPSGSMTFCNVQAVCRGKSPDFLVVGAHYDAKKLELCPDFAAANDGGSGVGVLLSVLQTLSKQKIQPPLTVCFVFFDGEEAQISYTEHDGLHGSRRTASLLASGEKGGFLKLKGKCRGMILMDMVGDQDLKIGIPRNSSEKLRKLAHRAAQELDMQENIFDSAHEMLDDHVPFLKAGIPAVDLIDFEYGPDNVFWHTSADTPDKLSEESLRKSADLLLRMIMLAE